jgi:hypothetical protein
MAKLALQTITQDQKEWLSNQAKSTGESIASIVRGLIQAEVNKSKRIKK